MRVRTIAEGGIAIPLFFGAFISSTLGITLAPFFPMPNGCGTGIRSISGTARLAMMIAYVELSAMLPKHLKIADRNPYRHPKIS